MPTDDNRLHRVDDADMLQTATLILFDYVFFAAYVQAAIRFWRKCAVVCVPVSNDYGRFPIPRELCTYTSVQLGLKLVCLTMDETLTSNDLHVYYC